ncbi:MULTISPECIES: pilus assembly protein CpaE [unclassified Pseudactinotalea]|uniref:pilus assembly protein CpaE n=1 Tax=unclassified Pseudactinotalea TaxID=2649176 RepID=UPI00128DE0F3|nr:MULTISPECIES: pilus assembly protein CpaE [unclassified Pseudactinotalea]MPV50303.1 pilus assembly protein CpaE [Pseudactinotalea sp. HY160]QGH68903.1 pilus assembly protein CpaE [Pseudactinotalea sp. HY158]
MISDDHARDLRDSGLAWHPAPGDRFRVEAAALGEEVFILSDMVIEARAHPTGTVLAFNGTTEWALDSVAMEQALWLPREDQLRAFLGEAFRGLHRTGDGFRVRTRLGDEPAAAFTAADPEDAYAAALLDLLHRAID